MKNKLFLFVLMVMSTCACNKTLDKKSNKSLVIPQTLADLQAILDDNYILNLSAGFNGEASADNFFLSYPDWSSLPFQSDRSIYVWDKEIFFDNSPGQNEWAITYSMAYRGNLVLHQIQQVNTTTRDLVQWNNVKGSAYFLRAYGFSIIARNYAKAYDSTTAATDPGIPLRLSIDFNEVSTRADLQETYTQIISDLKASISLLPVTPQHPMRPSRPAAYALLARTYLTMHDYKDAALYTDSALQINNKLMDYNNDPAIDSSSATPFAKFNTEVIYHHEGTQNSLYFDVANIDSNLYNSYDKNDLRKLLFFIDHGNGTMGFKGNYTADISLFCGFATDELYLMRAECAARAGHKDAALNDLNSLLIKRWKAGLFTAYTALNAAEALKLILVERRKELLMRDLRWMDIKRLNKEGAGLSITRNLNGVNYSLAPNDNRFALPIPANVIQLSGISQNPR